jgi:hypothetical protein
MSGTFTALPLGQSVRDDDVAVEEIVIGRLLVPAFAETPVGLEVLLDCFGGDGQYGEGLPSS